MTAKWSVTCDSCSRDLGEVEARFRLTITDGNGCESHACSPNCLLSVASDLIEREDQRAWDQYIADLRRVESRPSMRRPWWRFGR